MLNPSLKALTMVLLLGVCFPFARGFCEPSVSPPVERTEPDSRFINFRLPPGSAFHVLLQTPINTEVSQLDDPVEAITDQDLFLYEELMLPKNTRFVGKISRLEAPFEGRDGILGINFHQVILTNGEKMPIAAHVRTTRPDHLWGGGSTQGTKPYLSTQRVWGIGEYNKIVYGGPRAMGKHIILPPGEHWTIVLDSTLNIVKSREEEY